MKRQRQSQISSFFTAKQPNTGASKNSPREREDASSAVGDSVAVVAVAGEVVGGGGGEEGPSSVVGGRGVSIGTDEVVAAEVACRAVLYSTQAGPQAGGGGGGSGKDGSGVMALQDTGDDAPEVAEQRIENSSSGPNLSSISSADIPAIPVKNQPSSSFLFPVTGGRRCHSAWFSSHPWLHYDQEKDAVLCYVCVKASGMIDKGNTSWFCSASPTFVITGFRKWKKALDTFKQHEQTNFHQKNVELIFHRESVAPVTVQLDKKVSKEQEIARTCLRSIISSVRFLARTGNALRGHEHDDGNLIHLLEERSADVLELQQWLERRNSYLSNDIQNELVEIMAHEVQREIVEDIQSAPYYAVIADGTTDANHTEQFSVSVRRVDPETLVPKEYFLGMYCPDDSTGKTLASAIKDVLLRLGLPLQNLRGFCFDGASNMSGRYNGVQALLKIDQPKSLYVHCSNHALDLTLQEVSKKVNAICDMLMLVRDTTNIISESSKRRGIYANVLSPTPNSDENTPPSLQKVRHLLPLCPTRWCVRAQSLTRFKSEYSRVEETLKAILLDPNACTPEKKASVRGYLKKMKKMNTIFFLFVGLEVFGPCEELAKALQKTTLTATGAKEAAHLLSETIAKLRRDVEFNRIFSDAEKFFSELNPDSSDGSEISTEVTPGQRENPERTRRPPLRLERVSNPAPPAQLTPEQKMKKEYVAVLDKLRVEIEGRFDQPDLDKLELLENILLNAFNGVVPSEEEKLKEQLGIYAEDFAVGDLHAQLKLLKNLPGGKPTSCAGIAERLANLEPTTRSLLNQVILLTILVMTIPASAATAERSFSFLRRLKTEIRAMMTQPRLTHLLLLRVYQEKTKALNIEKIMREFVSRNATRKAVFGKV